MKDQLDGLIEVLLDPLAREDERDDAAMDLYKYDDDRVIDTWLKVINTPYENEYLINDCCEYLTSYLFSKRNKNPNEIKLIIDNVPDSSKKTMLYYLNKFESERS